MTTIWPLPWLKDHAKALALTLMALAAVAYVGFIYRYGVNVPFQDEWAIVILYRSVVHGHLTLTALWTQHNENRMLFPNLLMLGLDELSRFDTKVEMYVSAAMLLVAVALVWLLYQRTVGRSPLWFLPAGFLLLSWVQYVVTLQGFAIALYLVVLGLAVSLVALAAAERRPALLAVAIAAATVASYSSTQGLAVWAAGLVFLLARGPSRLRCWLWVGSACVISAIYWIGFIWSDTGGGVRWDLDHLRPSLHYFFLLAGAVISPSRVLRIGLTAQAIVGLILILAGLAAYGYWLWRRSSGEWLAVPLALIVFGVLIDILITIGRAHLGTPTATSPRYTLFNLWLFAGVWLAFAAIFSRTHLQWSRAAVIVLAVLCLVQIVGSYHAGLIDGRITRAQRQEAVVLLRHYRTAPEDEVVPLVYQLYPGFKSLAAFLAHEHLSVFHDPGS